MDELGPDEQKFLDAMRITDEPRDDDRARVRATLLASIGAGAVVTTTATAAATTATKAGLAVAPWKIVVAAASVIVVGSGAVAVVSRTSAPSVATTTVSPTTAALPPTSVPATPVEVEALPEKPAAAPTASAVAEPHAPVAARPAPRASAPPPSDDVDAELALLTQAQQALKRGDPNAALQSLGRHAKEHPRGALSVEREGLRAVASCEAKRPDGRALADRFLLTNPGSPLVARVRTACVIDPAPKP